MGLQELGSGWDLNRARRKAFKAEICGWTKVRGWDNDGTLQRVKIK